MASLREFVAPAIRSFDIEKTIGYLNRRYAGSWNRSVVFFRPAVVHPYTSFKKRMGQLLFLIHSDLYRYTGKIDARSFLTQFITNPGFQYTFWMRLSSLSNRPNLLRFTIHPIARFFLNRCKYKYGLSISFDTKIGSGFYIGHFGGIVVNNKAVIGKNCNISHGVTIGETYRGERAGCPVIGDNVYIGPGAKIIGRIFIGDNAAIGANCVVTRDVPPNAVVVGMPGRVISYKGSGGYISLTDYEIPAR